MTAIKFNTIINTRTSLSYKGSKVTKKITLNAEFNLTLTC